MPRFLRDDLAAHLVGKAQDDLGFTSPRGSVLRVQNFRRRHFDRAATEVGVEGQHTDASLAIASGASVKGGLDAAFRAPRVPPLCPEGQVISLTQRETGT